MNGSLENKRIAYFSMEIGFDSRVPTYSGGLGILAGDTLKACADLKIPIIGITLLAESGYFFQKIDEEGNQIEMPTNWSKDDFLKLLPVRVSVNIEGKEVQVQVWEYMMKGFDGYSVPLYFLDTNIDENDEYQRTLTHYLYGEDKKYRLCQEIILGIGGVRAIEALGYNNIEKYHMNEGHASLLVIELLERTKKENGYDIEAVRKQCIFTTHTPVPAGHDKFSCDLVRNVFHSALPFEMPEMFCQDDEINMTLIGMNFSHYINGVAKRHQEVSREMFPDYKINFITNGVHSFSWTADPFKKLYDKYFPGWKQNPFFLKCALSIPEKEIWEAHQEAKKPLIDYVNRQENVGMDYDIFTIGFARRVTPYKRADLLFTDINRLLEINEKVGKIQIIFAGKAHPQDVEGKELIKSVFSRIKELKDKIKAVYLENYDMKLGKLITSGVDLWLNNPLRPREASGTSGMKAAHNAIPSFSVLDGWWIEGHIENVTGWSIGSDKVEAPEDKDLQDLYGKLEKIIIPMFYNQRSEWLNIMKHSIAINASFFNTHRMIQQYVTNAYFK
ncbi:alpha-glucan family phosphorylase [bacterium]|nr:alpha-glucan family phosphorylase [bacterium]